MTTRSTTLNGYGLRTPSGWWECTLKDVCNGNGGVIQTGPFGSQLHAHDYKDTGTPVVMPQQLGDNQISIEGIARISDEDVKRLKRHCLRRGDIVFSRRGDVTRRAFITKREKGWLCGTGCMLIRPHHPKLWNEYLAFFFSLHEVKEYITKQAVGATMPNLNTGILEAVPLFLPSLTYQKKAVAILSAYDDLIENNTRRIAILEEMAQSLYREWFVNFRFPGHENARFIDSPLGKIPEGWVTLPFSQSAEFVNGFAFKPEHWGGEGKPIIKIAELKNGVTAKTPRHSGDGIPEKYTVRTGDVLFSWSADLDAYIWPHEEGLLNQHLFTVLPNSGFTKQFLYFALRHRMPEFRNLSLGTTMRHIKRSALDHVSFVCPPPHLRNAFTEHALPLIQQIIVATKKVCVLRITRDLLLPKLISGQLDVEELDIDTGELLAEVDK